MATKRTKRAKTAFSPTLAGLIRPDNSDVVVDVKLPLERISSGKVGETYKLDDTRRILIRTDRISAFDRVLPNGIPEKGRILNELSKFWFDRTKGIMENHLLPEVPSETFVGGDRFAKMLDRRAMVVKTAEVVPIECIVRGYLAGSVKEEYRTHGTISGIPMPSGLLNGSKLPDPIFTPSTKAEGGQHDENITKKQMTQRLVAIYGKVRGEVMADMMEEKTLELYTAAWKFAIDRGIIIADTKLEFGLRRGKLILIDEALTPDSSRFWPVAGHTPGREPESFDKQYVRNYLTDVAKWDKKSPAPQLPADVVANTTSRYVEAYERITGKKWK